MITPERNGLTTYATWKSQIVLMRIGWNRFLLAATFPQLPHGLLLLLWSLHVCPYISMSVRIVNMSRPQFDRVFFAFCLVLVSLSSSWASMRTKPKYEGQNQPRAACAISLSMAKTTSPLQQYATLSYYTIFTLLAKSMRHRVNAIMQYSIWVRYRIVSVWKGFVNVSQSSVAWFTPIGIAGVGSIRCQS